MKLSFLAPALLVGSTVLAQQPQIVDQNGYDIAVLRAEIGTQHIAMQPGTSANFTVNLAGCQAENRQSVNDPDEGAYDIVTLDCTAEAERLLGMPILGQYIAYNVHTAPLAQGGQINTQTLSGATCRWAEIDTVSDQAALGNAKGVGFNTTFNGGGNTFIPKGNLVPVTVSGAPATATLAFNGKPALVHRFGAIVGCASEQALASYEFKPYMDFEPAGAPVYHVWETFSGNHSLQLTQNEAWSVPALVSSTNLDASFFATPLPPQADAQITNGNAEFGNYVEYAINHNNGNVSMTWGTPGGPFATLDPSAFVVLTATPGQPASQIEVNYLASQATRPPGLSSQPSPMSFPSGYTLELDYQVGASAPQSAQGLVGGSCFGLLDKCFQLPLPAQAAQVTYSFKWTNTQSGQTWIDDNRGQKYRFQAVAAPETQIAVAEAGTVQVNGTLAAGGAFTINYDGNRALTELRQAGISPGFVTVTAAITFTGSAGTSTVNLPLRALYPQNSGGPVPNYIDQIDGVIPAAIPAGTTGIQLSFQIANSVEGQPSGSTVESGSQFSFAIK